jgi:hypothetical protein
MGSETLVIRFQHSIDKSRREMARPWKIYDLRFAISERQFWRLLSGFNTTLRRTAGFRYGTLKPGLKRAVPEAGAPQS